MKNNYIIMSIAVADAISSYARRYPHLRIIADKAYRKDARAIVTFARAISALSMPLDVPFSAILKLYKLASTLSPRWA